MAGMERRTMTLNLTDREMEALEETCRTEGPLKDTGCPAGNPSVSNSREST